MGRKSNATLAAEAAAALAAAQQTTSVVEAVVESVIETPVQAVEAILEPSEGDDTDVVVETHVTAPESDPEQDSPASPEETVDLSTLFSDSDSRVDHLDDDEPDDVAKVEYELEEGFQAILKPTMVGDECTGYLACPRAVFLAVQQPGWQRLIDSHPAKHALQSVVYWLGVNGSVTVRCMSSSKFAEVV